MAENGLITEQLARSRIFTDANLAEHNTGAKNPVRLRIMPDV